MATAAQRRLSALQPNMSLNTMSSNMSTMTQSPNMSVASLSPNMSTQQGPRYSPAPAGQTRANQTIAPQSNMTPMQPNMSTPQGPRYAPPVTTPLQPNMSVQPVARPTTTNTATTAEVDPVAAFNARQIAIQTQNSADMYADKGMDLQGNALPVTAPTTTPATSTSTVKPPTAPQATTPTQPSQIDTLRQQYTASLEMSPEEADLQRRLADIQSQQAALQASEALGIEKVSDQPIAMNFITGQSAAIQRQAAARQQALMAQAQPITQELAIRQAQRELTQQRALQEMQFAQQDEATRIAQEQAGMGEIREFGGQLVRVMPDGRVETLAEAPTTAEQFTLSPGQVRFDSQGNVVATGATDPAEQLQLQKLQLDIYKTQQDLAMSGQQLSPQQIQDAVNKGYTSEADLKLYSSMALNGIDVPKKLTADQQKLAASVQSAVTDLQYIRDNVGRRFLPNWAGNKQYGAAESNIADVMTRLRSGAAITAEEEKLYKGLLPKATDSVETATAKLDRLDSVLKGFLGTEGSTQQQNQIDYSGISLPHGFSTVGSDTNKATSLSLGNITGYGSPLWKHGLDIDLKKGDPVRSDVSGTVEFVGNNGGFGQQVRIKDVNGNSVWYSHLDGFNVKPGQTVSRGTLLGLGGNTGSVIPMGGGDGSHLDLTVKRADGSFMPPEQIAQTLKSFA
jgi:murein DD-endopeptidase MepM/ murein hydrolase activator NlpD